MSDYLEHGGSVRERLSRAVSLLGADDELPTVLDSSRKILELLRGVDDAKVYDACVIYQHRGHNTRGTG